MSLRLRTLSSGFIFNFPSDFLPQEVINDFSGFIDAYHMPYDNIIDYLNSTIKSVSYPGISLTPVEQKIMRGKVMAYKPSVPAQDLVATHDITVTFNDIDGHANYFLMDDIIMKHYLDTDHLHINPFTVTTLDMWRNSVWQIRYYQLIAMNLSDTLLDYSVQKVNAPEFSVTFRFNWIEKEFLFNKTKILATNNSSNVLGNSSPLIINK